jgi:hypothetical protein
MKINPRYYLLILLLAVTAKKISSHPHDMEIIQKDIPHLWMGDVLELSGGNRSYYKPPVVLKEPPAPAGGVSLRDEKGTKAAQQIPRGSAN